MKLQKILTYLIQKEKPKPCPVIKILKDAKKITSFKNNKAKDISGIMLKQK